MPIMRPVDIEETKLRRDQLANGVAIPTPPFWGAQVIENVPVKALLPYLNDNMLYQFHWGYKKEGRKLDEFLAWARKELRPVLQDLLAETEESKVFAPQAAYGYWKAAGEGNDLVRLRGGRHDRVLSLQPAAAEQGRTGSASPTSSATSTATSATSSACRW